MSNSNPANATEGVRMTSRGHPPCGLKLGEVKIGVENWRVSDSRRRRVGHLCVVVLDLARCRHLRSVHRHNSFESYCYLHTHVSLLRKNADKRKIKHAQYAQSLDITHYIELTSIEVECRLQYAVAFNLLSDTASITAHVGKLFLTRNRILSISIK